MERLPPVEREPDLGTFLSSIFNQSYEEGGGTDDDWLVGQWVQLDTKMRQVAL